MEIIRKRSIESFRESNLNMAGISKKKLKTKKGEVIKYTITYRDIFGKQHTSGIYDTIKEAKKHLWEFEKVETDTQNITFGMIFKQFLKRAEMKYAKNTYEIYAIYYNKYLKSLDDIKYECVNSLSLQSFFDDLENKSSPYVAQHVLKLSRAAFNYAKKHRIIKHNTFDEIEKIELPKADINHLTIEELKRVRDECKRSYPQYYALLYTFMGTGAREGELFALTKDDFIPKENCIRINKQYSQRTLLPYTKTTSSNRYVYFFDDLKEVLISHVQKLDSNSILLFPNSKGGYIDAHNFRKRVFYKLLKLCGITKRVRLHDLRGSYIDATLSSGLSIKFTQNNVGHARAETTTNIYARNNSDMINKAKNVLNTIFADDKKCEQNVSNDKKNKKCKVIQFPQKSSGAWK